MNISVEIAEKKTPLSGEVRLSTKDLSLFYGDFQVLRNISLDIPKNAITAIIGPSGCGKSTFLRLFNRMNDLITGVSVQGTIELDGVNIYDRDIDVVELRKRVGMVFQKPNPFPMSVFENVAFGPKRHGRKNRMELEDIVEKSLKQAARALDMSAFFMMEEDRAGILVEYGATEKVFTNPQNKCAIHWPFFLYRFILWC